MTENIKEKKLLELVNNAVELRRIQNEAKEALSVIDDEILDRLNAMKITGTRIDGHFVSLVKRISTIGVTLAKARELGCTSIKVDSEKIKKLYAKGVKIKGVQVSTSIRITEAKDK